ncbi:MAG: hypothetical protein ACK5OX_18925 [Desertimonas sp.]
MSSASKRAHCSEDGDAIVAVGPTGVDGVPGTDPAATVPPVLGSVPPGVVVTVTGGVGRVGTGAERSLVHEATPTPATTTTPSAVARARRDQAGGTRP